MVFGWRHRHQDLAQRSVVGHGGENFMFLFLQVDLGGGSWGQGSLICLVVSRLDGGFGVSGQSSRQRQRGGQNTALLALLRGGGGSGFVVHSEEFSASSDDLGSVFNRVGLHFGDVSFNCGFRCFFFGGSSSGSGGF